MTTEPVFAIKIKPTGSARYQFLAPDGTLTSKRAHAALALHPRCEQFVKDILNDPRNAGTVAGIKIVAVTGGR